MRARDSMGGRAVRDGMHTAILPPLPNHHAPEACLERQPRLPLDQRWAVEEVAGGLIPQCPLVGRLEAPPRGARVLLDKVLIRLPLARAHVPSIKG